MDEIQSRRIGESRIFFSDSPTLRLINPRLFDAPAQKILHTSIRLHVSTLLHCPHGRTSTRSTGRIWRAGRNASRLTKS